MSDIWTQECKECEGSGEHPCNNKCSNYYYDNGSGCAHGDIDGPVSSNGCPICPTCKGARHMGLQVAVPAEHDGATGYMDAEIKEG